MAGGRGTDPGRMSTAGLVRSEAGVEGKACREGGCGVRGRGEAHRQEPLFFEESYVACVVTGMRQALRWTQGWGWSECVDTRAGGGTGKPRGCARETG